jgi:hypothetical protein
MPAARHITAIAIAMPALGAAFFASGCATAKVGDAEGAGETVDAGGDNGAGDDDDGDGGDDGLADAGGSTPDAAPPPQPSPVTLTQSNSLDVIGFTSIACFEAVNSYYRVFNLATFGIDGPLEVNKVTFGVEECTSGTGGLPATVLLHTLEGPLQPDGRFQLANLTRLESAETTIPDVAFPDEGEVGGALHEVPIRTTVPAGSTLVVEVTHPGFTADQALLMGANGAGETGLTYLRAPECDTNEPTPAGQIEDENGNTPTMHWVMVVDGETPE